MERARVPRRVSSWAVVIVGRAWISDGAAIQLDPAQQIRELDRREGRIRALVAGLGAGALDRLLDRVRRQHAEGDRNAGIVRDTREPAGAFARDVVEMRRRTLDHRAERNDRIVAAWLRQLARDERQVERTGRAHDLDLLVARAVALEHVDRAAHQLIDDEVIEARAIANAVAKRSVRVRSEQVALEGVRDSVVACRVPEQQRRSATFSLTYSTTSRSNPDRPCICFGADSTRIRCTPRSRRICAPMP